MYSTLRGCEVRPLLICDNSISISLSLKRYVLVSVARCYCVWFVGVHFRGCRPSEVHAYIHGIITSDIASQQTVSLSSTTHI